MVVRCFYRRCFVLWLSFVTNERRSVVSALIFGVIAKFILRTIDSETFRDETFGRFYEFWPMHVIFVMPNKRLSGDRCWDHRGHCWNHTIYANSKYVLLCSKYVRICSGLCYAFGMYGHMFHKQATKNVWKNALWFWFMYWFQTRNFTKKLIYL